MQHSHLTPPNNGGDIILVVATHEIELVVARFSTFYCLTLNTSLALLVLDVTALEHNALEPISLEPILQELKYSESYLTCGTQRYFPKTNPAPPGTTLGLDILNASRQP
jgi:hypothetical protein